MTNHRAHPGPGELDDVDNVLTLPTPRRRVDPGPPTAPLPRRMTGPRWAGGTLLAAWWVALLVVACTPDTAHAPPAGSVAVVPPLVPPAAPTTGATVPMPRAPLDRADGDDNGDGVIHEDESGWDCARDGNRLCAPQPRWT